MAAVGVPSRPDDALVVPDVPTTTAPPNRRRRKVLFAVAAAIGIAADLADLASKVWSWLKG
ncbi:hypothetical protein GCM10010195_71100 [Kitasatospora griseola]|nr:hypothetical protein GCM10010195_71100 [Kitasatospora griseola]